MKTNRRNFFRLAGITGAGILSGGMASCQQESKNTIPISSLPEIEEAVKKKHTQRFNMSGYAAPKMDKVRIGFIGLGDRGSGAVVRMAHIDGVEIKALCDKRPAAVEASQKTLGEMGLPEAATYTGDESAWKKLCERGDLDLVYICTPWSWHTPMAVYAMENGKHAATEVPAATTIDEAWQLVETSERTKKHCMMLENCCYDFFELLTLNMARQGYFGDIVHAEGAYLHTLLGMNFAKPQNNKQSDGAYTDMWRLKENFRNGNLYPTHGLGPVCQVMNVNRGDKMEYLTAMQTNDFQMAKLANELAEEDSFYQEFAGKEYRGNHNITSIRTAKGRTITVKHDVTSTRPYSRIHQITGTKATAQKWPNPQRISIEHRWASPEELKKFEDQYTPEIVKRVGEMAKEVGGHGGMDFIMDWRLIDCLRNGLPLDQDVYDAALWSVIAPLSEWSVANRSNSIEVPDFTCGSWESNAPIDLSLDKGGNTRVVNPEKADETKQLHV